MSRCVRTDSSPLSVYDLSRLIRFAISRHNSLDVDNFMMALPDMAFGNPP